MWKCLAIKVLWKTVRDGPVQFATDHFFYNIGHVPKTIVPFFLLF